MKPQVLRYFETTTMSRAQVASVYSEADYLVELTRNDTMVVNDRSGRLLSRLEASAAALEKLCVQKPVQQRDPLLARRLARVYHAAGMYLKEFDRCRESLAFFSKERALLEELFSMPPQDDGTWQHGAKPWPQDKRALSICHLAEAEATDTLCCGKGKLARKACELYSAGLSLEMTKEAVNNHGTRQRFNLLKEKCGWHDEVGLQERGCKRRLQERGCKSRLQERGCKRQLQETLAVVTTLVASPEPSPVEFGSAEVGRQTVETRCAIGRDTLHDPAKLVDCRHVSRCNYDALRTAGNLCPIMGCSVKNRFRLMVRDDNLRSLLRCADPEAEHLVLDDSWTTRRGLLVRCSEPSISPISPRMQTVMQARLYGSKCRELAVVAVEEEVAVATVEEEERAAKAKEDVKVEVEMAAAVLQFKSKPTSKSKSTEPQENAAAWCSLGGAEGKRDEPREMEAEVAATATVAMVEELETSTVVKDIVEASSLSQAVTDGVAEEAAVVPVAHELQTIAADEEHARIRKLGALMEDFHKGYITKATYDRQVDRVYDSW